MGVCVHMDCRAEPYLKLMVRKARSAVARAAAISPCARWWAMNCTHTRLLFGELTTCSNNVGSLRTLMDRDRHVPSPGCYSAAAALSG